MHKLLKTLILLAALTGHSELKPALTISSAFPTGKERSYAFTNDVDVTDQKDGPAIGYRITAVVKAGSVWGTDEQKLLKFDLIAPRLHVRPKDAPTESREYVEHRSHLNDAVNKEFYAVWHLGEIKTVYIHAKEDPSLINLKKAIISMFQYQLLDGEYDEIDVSGNCRVGYISKTPTIYEKVKRSCESGDIVAHRRQEPAIALSTKLHRSAEFKVTQDGTLEKVESREYHQFEMAANKAEGFNLESTISMKFDGSISNIATLPVGTLKEATKTLKGVKKQTLLTDVRVPFRSQETVTFKDAVKDHRHDLTDDKIGTHQAATALLNMVHAAKTTKKAEILKALNGSKNKAIIAQLLDVLAATQTVDAHAAAKEILKIESTEETDNAERYLQGLAVGSRPQEAVITDLLNMTNAKLTTKLHDTLTQTIASMANRYTRLVDQGFASDIVETVTIYLTKALSEAKDETEKEMYIRALNNLQSPKTVNLLIRKVHQSERLVSVAAMKALRNFPTNTWTSIHRKQFDDIFFQKKRKFDSSARTLALDILLALRPGAEELRPLLQYLRSNDRAFEVKQYLLQKIKMLSDGCSRFRAVVKQVMAEDSQLNNYHVVGQKGLSTALSRKFSKAPAFNMTLLSVQEMYGGTLKRGLVDMTVDSGRDKFSVFTLGLYASGLSSFAGSSSTDNEDDEEETSAGGMEVTVQGAYFRPLQFFNSKTELTGLVFSGGASSPTAAYTATTLLQDHEEVIRLQNGAGLSVNVLGALSINLYGQTEISLWYQTALCSVNQESGMSLKGSFNVETSFINLKSHFTTTQEPKLLLKSIFEMPSVLCLALSQPDTILRHHVEKEAIIHGTKYWRKNARKIEYKMPGFTHALNQKNNDMCDHIERKS